MKILDPRIGKEFPLPHYSTPGSAGIELVACIDKPITLKPGENLLIKTGISIYIGNPNYAGFLMPKSGLGHKKGLVLANLVGLMDSDYQGEVLVSAWNRNHKPVYEDSQEEDFNDGTEHDIIINPGDPLGQYVCVHVEQLELEVVDEYEKTERGEGGFGHTSVKEVEIDIIPESDREFKIKNLLSKFLSEGATEDLKFEILKALINDYGAKNITYEQGLNVTRVVIFYEGSASEEYDIPINCAFTN